MARLNAELQYYEKTVGTTASKEQHIQEFEELWTWNINEWLRDLVPLEFERFSELVTENERDVFRIVRGFAENARRVGEQEFSFVCGHMARVLGLTVPRIAKIPDRLNGRQILEKTAEHIANRYSQRFQWIAPTRVEQPF